MKKVWRRVQVLNAQYKVYKIKGLVDEGYQGVCDATLKIIMVDASLPTPEFNRTLMHELFHAHQFESGLCEVLDHQALEMAAESLAGFICGILAVKFV